MCPSCYMCLHVYNGILHLHITFPQMTDTPEDVAARQPTVHFAAFPIAASGETQFFSICGASGGLSHHSVYQGLNTVVFIALHPQSRVHQTDN